jgi:hypothetical protein
VSDTFPNNMNLFEEDKSTELNFGTGIEPEDTGGEDEITEPFDTTQIRVETKPSNIDLLLSRIKHDEIDLAPGFQRKGGIWKDSAQSRLIESLLIRIPIPAFYMDATNEDKWLVVDGLQRLTALKRYIIDQDLKLSGLEFLTQLHGKRYSDLPRNFQRRISETQVTVYLIEKGTPPEVKFNIFKRINTGGLPLSSQEIRHALNQGVVTEFLARLAGSSEFKIATWNSIRDDRMADRECVLRFLAFAINHYTEYKSKDLDSFLNESMNEMNHMPGARLNELGHRFLRAMTAAHDIFQATAFRKPGRGTMNPINKALFEAVSVNLDRLNDEQLADLKERNIEVKSRFKELINDRDFEKSISVSTGNVSTVRYRFSKIELLIQDVLL